MTPAAALEKKVFIVFMISYTFYTKSAQNYELNRLIV